MSAPIFTTDTATAVSDYAELGFATLPLLPGTKDAYLINWQSRSSSEMWEYAVPGANVGVRCGDGLAVMDCDEEDAPGTFARVQDILFGLGFEPGSYPVVQTASEIGRQVFITLAGKLPGHSRRWDATFGAGEFRYGPGAYVVAPPSVVNGRRYTRIAGDLRQLPRVTVADVLPLLKNKDTATAHHERVDFAALLPVATEPGRTSPRNGGTQSPTVPRLAWRILSGDAETIGRYQTRSEAEQAALVSLVNGGNSFDDVHRLFVSHPAAGKFAEMCKHNRKRAEAWLWRSYQDAQKWATTHESEGRRTATAALAWAEATAWPGRTGATDRAVFVAHATIAHLAGCVDYAADCRTLAELAAVSHVTATAATHRLIAAGRLRLEREHTVTLSNVYRLSVQTFTLPNIPLVRKCKGLHDAFRGHWLGQPGAELWEALQSGEILTATELAQRTGRDKRTVAGKLERMGTLDMVKTEGDAWRACPVDLDRVARLLGTAGAGERQKAKHAADRRNHRETLKQGRKETDESKTETVTADRAPHEQGDFAPA